MAAAAEPQLREQVVPLETRMGREVHRVVVDLLGVDEREPGRRETVQITLDLARGLGLANLLTDDSRRRAGVARQWAAILDSTLPARAPLTSASHPVRPPASSVPRPPLVPTQVPRP